MSNVETAKMLMRSAARGPMIDSRTPTRENSSGPRTFRARNPLSAWTPAGTRSWGQTTDVSWEVRLTETNSPAPAQAGAGVPGFQPAYGVKIGQKDDIEVHVRARSPISGTAPQAQPSVPAPAGQAPHDRMTRPAGIQAFPEVGPTGHTAHGIRLFHTTGAGGRRAAQGIFRPQPAHEGGQEPGHGAVTGAGGAGHPNLEARDQQFPVPPSLRPERDGAGQPGQPGGVRRRPQINASPSQLEARGRRTVAEPTFGLGA